MEISSVSTQMFDPEAMAQMRQAMFKQQDIDGNGGLDSQELGVMSEDTGMSIDEILSQVDLDSNGLITEAELEATKPQGPPPGMGGGRMGGTLDDDSVNLLLDALEQYKTASDEDDDEQTDLLMEYLEKLKEDDPYGAGTSTGLFVNQAG